jgi:co-chaperonin GroES (HSP10)
MIPRPRNTLVLCALIEKTQRVIGSIVQTTKGDEFTQARILAVGPGNIAAEGGRSDTVDLKSGQIVTVLYKSFDRNGVLKNVGTPVPLDDGTVVYLYEQARILTIDEDAAAEIS